MCLTTEKEREIYRQHFKKTGPNRRVQVRPKVCENLIPNWVFKVEIYVNFLREGLYQFGPV